jgi:hypothetical protein
MSFSDHFARALVVDDQADMQGDDRFSQERARG